VSRGGELSAETKRNGIGSERDRKRNDSNNSVIISMIIFIPFEVVAEEEKGRIGEDGWTGFALFNKLLQFFYCCCVHPSDVFCFWERESACRGFLIYAFLSKWKWKAACLFFHYYYYYYYLLGFSSSFKL